MATRHERVVLELDDKFSTPMAKAAAITALMERQLKGLDGASVGATRGLTGLNKGDALPATDANARKAEQSINQLTGRLRLLADVAAIAGPTLVPLGAAAIPGLAAMATQAGVAAGALGVTLLAVTGLGDSLDALNAYQLEPTADNLAALQTEMANIGPAGADFVRFIDSLMPQLQALQDTARAGMLPGVEEGIDSLLSRVPEVRNIIAELAAVMGNLAADAGDSLGGPEWDTFFSWLESRGGPILDEFSRTVGNFVTGLANLLVAFDPAAQDFSSGLLDMSESFAQWSQSLDSNHSFQEFLAYVRESGPQALDLIGSLIDLLSGIVTAAAPIGSALLPVFTQVVEIFAAIASSDIGSPIIAGVAALSAYNRVMAVTVATQARLNASGGLMGGLGASVGRGKSSLAGARADVSALAATWATAGSRTAREQARVAATTASLKTNLGGLTREAGRVAGPMAGLALASSGLASGFGLSNTASLALVGTIAGPWGAALGAGAGFALDLAAANDDVEDSARRAQAAIESMDASVISSELARVQQELADKRDDIDTDSFGEFFKNMVDPTVISEMTREAFGAQTAVEGLQEQESNLQAALAEAPNAFQEAIAAQTAYTGSMRNAALAGTSEARALEDATAAMRAKREEALRGLNAELDYKGAVLDARDALKENGKTVNENTRDGQANLKSLYGLAGAWNDQSNKVKNASGALRNARGNFVETATAMGMAEDKAKRLAQRLFEIPKERIVKIDLPGVGAQIAVTQQLANQIERLRDRTITITTQYKRVNSVTDALPDRTPGSANGTTVPKTGRGYADRHLYLLADGEEVISNRFGQADRHRSLLKDINANRLAAGGTTGDDDEDKKRKQPAWKRNPNSIGTDLSYMRSRLRGFENALERSTDRLNSETSARDGLLSKMAEIGSNAVGAVRSDIFAAPSNPWQASNANPDAMLNNDIAEARELTSIIGQLRDKGVTGPLLAELLGKQDLALARTYNALPADVLATRVGLYDQRERELSSLNAAAGDAGYGPELREQTAQMRAVQEEVNRLRQDVKDQTKTLDRASDRNSQEVTAGINGAGTKGKRNQKKRVRHGMSGV